MNIDTNFYKGFWSDYDYTTFAEWSETTKAEWYANGETWEVKPSEWQDYLEAHWDKIASNLE